MLLLVASLLVYLPAQETLTLEVDAGERPGEAAIVSWELPDTLRGAGTLKLFQWVNEHMGRPVPAQADAGDPPRLWWIARRGARYEVATGSDHDAPREPTVRVHELEGRLSVQARGFELLAFRQETVAPPAGVDALHARSGYLHPVRAPSGRIVTGDFPAAHRHHHGIWFPWTRTLFEGRAVDFWNSATKQGKVECIGVDEVGGGPVFAWFVARQEHVDLTAPEGPRDALEETWRVRAFDHPDATVFDLESVQSCATDSPLEVLEYHYGGLAFRGPETWEGADGATFLTSEGMGRLDGDATRARWCAVTGEIAGKPATLAVLGHPENFRAPQPLRLHPAEPYLCWAPGQLGPFEIRPGEPYVSRFRFVVLDGPADAERFESMWRAYANPPAVRVVED